MYRRFSIALAITLLVSFSCPGQDFRGALPFFTNYHPSDYKGYSQNWSIASNSRGLLFFANGDGIMLYNGRTWSKILLNNNATPSSFFCDENDLIWVGAQSELGCLVPDEEDGYHYVSLTALIPDEFREFGFVLSIQRSRDGVYFKTGQRIFRLVDRKIYTIPCERGSQMFGLRNSIFLYEPSRGFSTVSGNKLLKVVEEQRESLALRCIVPLNRNKVLLVDAGSGLYTANFDFSNPYAVSVDVTRKVSPADRFLVENDPFDAIRMSNGYFAFATQRDGTVVTDSALNILYHLSTAAGVMNETHNFLYEDRQKNLWIALDHGICKVSAQSPLTYYDDYHGVKGSVLDVIRFSGKLFIATWQGVFYQNPQMNASDMELFLPLKGIASQTWDLEPIQLDGKHYLLASTSDGLFVIDSLMNVSLVHEGNYNYAKADPSDQRRVYAGGPSKIEFLYFGKGIRNPSVTQVPDLKSRVVNAVLAPGNRFFVGTARDGVFMFSAVRLTPSDPAIVFEMSAIGPSQGLPLSDAYYVYEYNKHILVGTQVGLYELVKTNDEYRARLFDNAFTPYYSQSQFINILRQDDSGSMWFQTNSKLSGKKSLYYMKSQQGKRTFHRQPFQTFPDIEFYSVSPEGDSVVWFGSDDGVFRFSWDACNSMAYQSPFSTILQRVSYKGNAVFSGLYLTQDVTSGIPEFPGGNLRFDFAAGYYINESQVRFKYFLEGFDNEWSEPSIENYKEYTSLPPGDYVFRVKAVNPFGSEGDLAEFAFSIPRPWYTRWWAWTIYLAIAASVVFGSVRFANRRLIRAKLRLESIVHSRTLEIQNQKKAAEIEKEKADKLLINILPVRIAEELKTTGKCQTEFYQNVTVLFTDFSGFTSIAETMDPEELVSKLDEIFAMFDDICSRNKLEKIKTIGDSHMSAGGIPVRNRTHAVDAVLAAMEMQYFLENLRQGNPNDEVWKLRIGINSGELTAGVVGKRKFAFDIWGDTVNTASRLQDAGEPGRINISNRTAELVSSFFELTYRGKKPIKHKGEVDMFFVDGIKPGLSIDGQMKRPNKAFWNQYNDLLDLRFLNF